MGYRIGSFNVHNLSFATKDVELDDNKSVRRDYSEIGYIIRNNFDIVALQEVLTDQVLSYLFPAFCGWNYCWKQSRSKTDDSNEGYAFAWNAQKIRPVTEPALWSQYKQDPFLGSQGLMRHPYYGRFTPSGTVIGGPFCEIRLLNTHIRFKPKSNKELPASDIELRKREFLILAEQILSRLCDRRYGNMMDAYTFLLGDYNLNLKSSGVSSPYVQDFVIIEDNGRKKELITVQDHPTTIKMHRETDPLTGEKKTIFGGFANNYDHFTYDRVSFNERGVTTATTAIDTVALYKMGDFEKHWREISDHIPIMLELNLK